MRASPPPLSPEGVRGLVFDLDGTLIDSYGAITDSVNAARRAHGLTPLAVDDVRQRVGHGLERLIEDVLGPDRVESGVRVFRETYDRICEEKTVALPGASATLASLRERGYRLSVASNKPARFSRRLLEGLGMLEHLAAVEGPDTVGATKPDPAMIHRCLERMGTAAGAAAYVGDMALDVESAARAGVPVVLIPGGSSEIDALRATGQLVLNRLSDILDLFPPKSRG